MELYFFADQDEKKILEERIKEMQRALQEMDKELRKKSKKISRLEKQPKPDLDVPNPPPQSSLVDEAIEESADISNPHSVSEVKEDSHGNTNWSVNSSSNSTSSEQSSLQNSSSDEESKEGLMEDHHTSSDDDEKRSGKFSEANLCD